MCVCFHCRIYAPLSPDPINALITPTPSPAASFTPGIRPAAGFSPPMGGSGFLEQPGRQLKEDNLLGTGDNAPGYSSPQHTPVAAAAAQHIYLLPERETERMAEVPSCLEIAREVMRTSPVYTGANNYGGPSSDCAGRHGHTPQPQQDDSGHSSRRSCPPQVSALRPFLCANSGFLMQAFWFPLSSASSQGCPAPGYGHPPGMSEHPPDPAGPPSGHSQQVQQYLDVHGLEHCVRTVRHSNKRTVRVWAR